MADTNLDLFVSGVATYLTTAIFPSIVQGLSERGVQIKVEDLLLMTQTPDTRSSTNHVSTTPGVPTMAFGGAVPTMAAAIAPTTNRKRNTAAPAPAGAGGCSYEYKRGENRGNRCGKAVSPGHQYCNSCLKTRKNLLKDMAGAGKSVPGAAPAVGSFPGMGNIPGYEPPNQDNTSQQGKGSMNVIAYDESRGLYLEPTHNFIVREITPGVIAVLGRLTEPGNKIVPLTSQEESTARSIGLVIGEDSNNVSTTISVTASVPAVPGVYSASGVSDTHPGLPQIPSLGRQVPAVPGIPQIPMMSQNH